MFEEEAVENIDENLVHKVFTALVEDGDAMTKTILDENQVAGVRSVLWEPEDVIGVAVYNGRYQRFANVLEEPAASGVFEGSVNQDIKYYAIYPYKENQQMSTSVSVNIPAKQTYKPNSFDGSAAPMAGKGNHAEPLYFMNLTGALAINMTGTAKIKSIVFETTSGEKVSGEGTVDPDYADYPVLTMSETADTYVVLDCGEGVQLSGEPTSFHFVLPPATYNGFDLLITTTDGQFMQKSTDKQLTIKRSIITKAASFAFENAADNFVKLSERGNANCYIVPQSGYYAFDGTVIGNGEFGFPANNNFHTDSPEIFPASVDILWEDVFGLIRGCGYDPSTGMVKFFASGNEGNAVLAAKDSEGNILWSWHIWMTDQPEEQIYNNNAGTLMDRNLGATSATPGDVGALGLLYQWGRKDPFLGAVSIDSSTQRESTITWPSPVSSDATNGTIGYSVLNPTVFIKYNGSNYDWYYTGDSSTDDSRWQSAKTVYDPCPSGWRVPDGGSEGVWALAGFTNTAFDDVNKGRSFEITSPEATWYPALGYLDRSNGALYSVGIDGHYWSVSPTGRSAFDLYFYGSSFNMTNSDDRAYGFAVRCTKDEGYVDISYPQVSHVDFDEITSSSAEVLAYVKSEGISPVIECGFIYGLNEDFSDGVRVSASLEGQEFSSRLSGLDNLSRYYVKAYAINSRGEAHSDTFFFDTQYLDGVINLSTPETSNCYLISCGGDYSFNCDVKGNSLESIGTPDTFEILWQMDNITTNAACNDLITNVRIEQNKVLLFTATGKEGNVLLAVKDLNGEVLWSWHLWITQSPKVQVYTNKKGVFEVLDRNLGATRADADEWMKSCGLVYFWGRKDPFWYGNYSSYSGFLTIESTIANPTMRHNISSWGFGKTSWMGEKQHISTLWEASRKTIYDPCPVGYRVATSDIFCGFTTTNHGSEVPDEFRVSGSFDHGWNFYIGDDSGQTSWYPVSYYAGNYHGGDDESGVDGFLWTSDYTENSQKSLLHFNSGIVKFGDSVGTIERADGNAYPVRCMKDR